MAGEKKPRNRKRTQAIRARMRVTGEPYTLAARRNDEEQAKLNGDPPPAEKEPG